MAFLARAVLPTRTLTAMALLALALSALLSQGLLHEHSPAAPAPSISAPTQTGLWRLPPGARGPVSSALGAEDPAYRITPGGGALHAANPAQHLSATFTARGVELGTPSGHARLRLDALGYGSGLVPLGSVAPSVRGNRVRYSQAGVNEWYANGPLGLEQGFTVARRGEGRGPLTLSLALAGLRPSLSAGGQSVTFGHGADALRYSELAAVDARGHALRAWMTLRGHNLLLQIDTRGARFPVRIDPLIQQGEKFTASDLTPPSQIATSVALSSDGNTVLVGGPEDNTLTGAAWVFTRSGSTWTQQGPQLTPTDRNGEAQFGISVALSADGNTALVGGINDESSSVQVGAAWVFTRSGTTWAQQGPKLTGGAEEVGFGRFGRSVALSFDGNTALVGAYYDEGKPGGGQKGAAFVFTRSGTTWSPQGAKLVGVGEEGEGQFGFSAALSADGNTALIGGPHDEAGKVAMVGAAWAFTRSGGTWAAQGGPLVGTGAEGAGELGSAVALSADGDTALAGAPGDGSAGATFVFARTVSAWAQQGAKLTPSDASGAAGFGGGVALSADGTTALIGGPVDKPGKEPEGAAWEFIRSGGNWSQQGTKLKGSGQVGEGEFGIGVALSADADTAVIGAPLDNGDIGAAFAFTNPPPPVTTGAASAVSFTTATLNGLVGAGASNNAYFQYGTTTAYGSSTSATFLGASAIARTLAASLSGLAPGTTIHFRLIAENSAGKRVGSDQSFTTPIRIGKELPPLPPIIEAVSQSHSSWRVGRHAASLARRRRAPLGTTFSVKLNQAASLSFAFTQQLSGRRVGHRCLAPNARNRHRHACKRTVTQGTLALPAHAGLNRVLFQGVLARNHTLKPGSYTLLISARNGLGLRSATRSLSFRIVR